MFGVEYVYNIFNGVIGDEQDLPYEFSLSMEALTAGYLPINRLYDMVRLVDPIQKIVVSTIYPQNDDKQFDGTVCCSLWNQEKLCDDCIAIRAYNENNYIKIKCSGGRMFLISAVSVLVDSKPLVLEMFKDVSGHGLLDIRDQESNAIYQMVGEINDPMSHDLLTGTYNQRYIFDRLPNDLSAVMPNQGLLIIFTRINNLNEYRSVNGFKAGEALIKDFAQTLQGYCQNNKKVWLARFEEAVFLISMPGTSETEAYHLAGQIKLALKVPRFNQIQASVSLHKIDNQSQLFRQDLWNYLNGQTARDKGGLNQQQVTPLLQSYFTKIALSKREIEVARLLLQGRTNYDIAQVLFVGIPTIKKHLSSIYKKAGVNSRLEFLAGCQSYPNK